MQPATDFTSRISLYPEFNSAILVAGVQGGVRPLDLDVVVFDEYGPNRVKRAWVAVGRVSVAGQS